MRHFNFTVALSAAEAETLYQGQIRYVVVESDQGLKLQLPSVNFKSFVCANGINGRFNVQIDDNNKIISLRRI